MIILFVKSQLPLFDMPVQVAGHVRKDGTVIKPHMRIQKVALRPHEQGHLFNDAAPAAPAKAAKKTPKLDKFLAKHGGAARMRSTLMEMRPEQRAKLVDAMAHIDGLDPHEVMQILGMHDEDLKPAAEPAKPAAAEPTDTAHAEGDQWVMPIKDAIAEHKELVHAIETPGKADDREEVKEQGGELKRMEAAEHALVEHTTKKGKVLRGVVRRDLNGHQAAAIDPYTFRKDGGWFIREKHLGAATPAQEPSAQPAPAYTPSEEERRAEAATAVDKSKEQAAKLRAAGQKLKADAEADLGRDRLANTARRARMAASAEADASQRIAIAGTMLNLADAIEAGDARHLKNVTTRAAVETLDGLVRNAIYEADRHLPYVEQERRKGRPPEPDDIRNARISRPKWGNAGSDKPRLLELLKGKRGAKALIDRVRASDGPDAAMVADLKKYLSDKDVSYALGWWNAEQVKKVARLARLGITNDHDLRLALAEYLVFRDGAKKADPVKEAERALVGKKVGVDFFPTPKPLAAKMAELAGVKPGMTVLEPSAGNGHLADAAREAGGEVDAIEISDALRNVLKAKGHNIAAHDFDTFEPGKQYDAVIMNPPFSDRRDAAHIMRAYDMLKPGGKLVAIAGEGVFFGSDKKAQSFRDWLDEHGAEVEKLPENTFKGTDLPAQTGANARLLVIEKPADAAAAPQPAAEAGPREGDTKTENGVEYVLRDGRWHRAQEEQAAEPGAVSESVLEDVGLLREFGGRWQYKFGMGGNWMTANSKEDAVSIATKTYHETPEAERMTRAQRDAKADADEYADSHRRYGHLSLDDLRKKHEQMGGEVESLQHAGRREFNGGGRRTSAAVSAQGARDVAEERARLGRYIEKRAESEEKPQDVSEDAALPAEPETDPDIELAEDRQDLADAMARDPHSEETKKLVRKVAEKLVERDEPVGAGTFDADDPNSPNYRYADTGHVAGSRKEQAASQVIKRAKSEGARVFATAIDWDELEQNPREAKELITKSNLFGEVDWDDLRRGGMEPGAGFLIDRIYAAIGQEPSEDNAQARKDYTLGLQTLRDRLERAKTAADVTDVLDALREEYDGKILTAEESARYAALGDEGRALFERSEALRKELDGLYNEQSRLRAEVYPIEREIEQRKKRGWAEKPELAAKLAEARAAADAAHQVWGDRLRATKDEREAIDQQRRDVFGKRDAIVLAAAVRNKLENPLHRAWNLMGDRFIGVLRYRSFKGSDAFAKHVTAAKTGKVADWSWMEKDVVRGPRVTKESARFQMKVADAFERIGGRAVAPQSTAELKAMFGLRDVQSGNWVLRDVASAKFHTEHSAAAFADLADLLGTSDDHVAMNGRLALAFGARGHGAKGFKDGAARAHYEPVHRIINLTKMGGGGTLAHEWFHALDNMAGEAEGGSSGVRDYFTENPDLLPAGELREAAKALRAAMLDGEHRVTKKETYTADDVRLAQRNMNSRFPNGISTMIRNAGNVHDAVQAIERHFGTDGSKKVTPRTKRLAADWRRIALGFYGGNPEGGEIAVSSGPQMSLYRLEAMKLDQGSADYWAQTHEMAARAFQAWTEDKLAEQGRRNDYLSSLADNRHHIDPLLGIQWKPFPEGEERTRINAAFDRLVAAMQKSNTLAKAMALLAA